MPVEPSGRVQRHQFRPGCTDNRTHLLCEVALDELAKHYSARSSCVCGLYSDVASSSYSRDQSRLALAPLLSCPWVHGIDEPATKVVALDLIRSLNSK